MSNQNQETVRSGKTSAELEEGERYSPVDPGAHLPRLSDIEALSAIERGRALSRWVSWFNGNRNKVPREIEEQLSEALRAFDREQAAPSREGARKNQDDFDQWVETLGHS